MTYVAANAFNTILSVLVNRFPTTSSLITLPEVSHEGRTIQGIRIGKPATQSKPALLLIGGCHARELVNPDILIRFASNVLYSYETNSDLKLGSVVYAGLTIQLIMSAIDIIIVPLINPDGRAYVQLSPDPWWRKNRNPNPGETCIGVDINRNYDLLWSSGIGTSSNSCSPTYKGSSAFSEPETRNVRWVIDNYPEIEEMVDVHSYSELALYPWGHDETQTTDPTMNFMNPAFNGQRGIAGDAYKEYMHPDDRDFFEDVGFAVRDAIFAVRGHCYTVKPSFLLYPTTGTSGTSLDYAYSRHIVDTSKRKIFAYVLETGNEFQPPLAEFGQITFEVMAALLEFCIALCCPILLSGRQHHAGCLPVIRTLDLFPKAFIEKTQAGQRYVSLLTTHFMEIRELVETNKRLYAAVVRLVRYTDQIARLHFADPPGTLDAKMIRNLDRALTSIAKARDLSVELKGALNSVRRDLSHFEGKTFAEGLKSADRENSS